MKLPLLCLVLCAGFRYTAGGVMLMGVGSWAPWSTWEECTQPCGTGVQYKSRVCVNGTAGLSGCPGSYWDARRCNTQDCGTASESSGNDAAVTSRVECFESGKALEYRGSAATTRAGVPCQKWTSRTPHFHTFSPSRFPQRGLGDHNFCRSPDNDQRPWCFTADRFKRWDYCAVPKCEETTTTSTTTTTTTTTVATTTSVQTTAPPGVGCFDPNDATGYRGNQSHTSSGTKCQIWDSFTPHSHIYTSSRFPGKGLGNHNHCRNPDGDVQPWCFTTDPSVNWAYCNVPTCRPDTTTQRPETATAMPISATCGRTFQSLSLDLPYRIVGGVEATPGSLPWQVSIRNARTHAHFCGGSIIDRRWIITAAHCIPSNQPSSYYGYAGKHRKYQQEPTELKILFSAIFRHEFFNRITLQNDITLLKVTEDLPFTDNIQPICLPTSHEKLQEGTMTVVSGWGTTQGTGSSNVLRQATVPIVDTAECRQLINGVYDGMICAGYKDGGKDSCQGDSGGPLAGLTDDNRYKLVGVVSWGYGCGLRNRPGVYAQVSYYLQWIYNIMANH